MSFLIRKIEFGNNALNFIALFVVIRIQNNYIVVQHKEAKKITSPEFGILQVSGVINQMRLQKIVYDEMKTQLSREFMEQEVHTILKQMAPLKARGPNGMPLNFFFNQNYWHLVGNDVTRLVLHCLNLITLPQPLKHTFVTLILKVK